MTMEEDQTKFTKLFVGGIPYHSADETLKEYFEQFDDIVEAVIIRERNSQRSKGYGFVSFIFFFIKSVERNCFLDASYDLVTSFDESYLLHL